jgi:hypothetical protein
MFEVLKWYSDLWVNLYKYLLQRGETLNPQVLNVSSMNNFLRTKC